MVSGSTASPTWWFFALFGILTLGVGVFFVVDPHETLRTFTIIAGIFLVVDGVVAVLSSLFGRAREPWARRGLGVISAIAGLILIKKPFETLVLLALIVGLWFFVVGALRFVLAFATPENRAGNIVLALVEMIAGVLILAWPQIGLATLAVILGIVLIIRGILFTIAGWQLRGAPRGARAEPAGLA